MIVFPVAFFSNQITSSLYAFTTFTFTNASASGHRGPTLNGCLTAYNTASNSWLTNTSYFNVTTEGIQQWTVPSTADYDITVAGARGGVNTQAISWISGGYGAVVKTRITLTQGTILSIVVGQTGSNRGSGPTGNYCGAAGGGGTFVYNSSSFDYYAVAGGGGGGASTSTALLSTFLSASGKHDTQSGTTIRIQNNISASGGTNGNGGGVSNRTSGGNVLFGPAGAGVFSSGSNGKGGGSGQSRISVSGSWWGGTFNPGQSTYGVSGGFGGGGGGGASDGTIYQAYNWAGGGGGYSGGAGGGNGGAGDGQYGGGGGSYYMGTFQTGSTGTNNGHGYVIITKI